MSAVDEATLAAIREAKAARGGATLSPAEIDQIAPPRPKRKPLAPIPARPLPNAPEPFAEDLAAMQGIATLYAKLSEPARVWIRTAVFKIPSK